MYRYCVYYFYETEDVTYPVTCAYLPYLKGIILRNPSECCMFIPGTYAQMLEDYE